MNQFVTQRKTARETAVNNDWDRSLPARLQPHSMSDLRASITLVFFLLWQTAVRRSSSVLKHCECSSQKDCLFFRSQPSIHLQSSTRPYSSLHLHGRFICYFSYTDPNSQSQVHLLPDILRLRRNVFLGELGRVPVLGLPKVLRWFERKSRVTFLANLERWKTDLGICSIEVLRSTKFKCGFRIPWKPSFVSQRENVEPIINLRLFPFAAVTYLGTLLVFDAIYQNCQCKIGEGGIEWNHFFLKGENQNVWLLWHVRYRYIFCCFPFLL